MTMIFHSGVPNFLWVEAFTTTTFLINRFPSSSINFNSPYFRLYGVHPNYSISHVFGLDVTHIHGILRRISLILK